MAEPELYKAALPVVVVPPGTVLGPEVLFDSPLPVWVMNQSEGEGESGPLPERIAPESLDLADEDLNVPVLAVYSGWYFSSGFLHNPFGNSVPSFLELVVGPDGTSKIQRVTRVDTGAVAQRVITGSQTTNWSRFDNVLE